jgi:hypothetical protein
VIKPDESAPIVYNGIMYLVAPAGLQWNNNQLKNDRAAAVNSNWLLGEGKRYTQIAAAIGISYRWSPILPLQSRRSLWGEQPLIPFAFPWRADSVEVVAVGPRLCPQTLRFI